MASVKSWHRVCTPHMFHTCSYGRSLHYSPLFTHCSGDQYPLPCDSAVLPLETVCASHLIGAELGWHVTCFSHWNVGRRNNVSLLSLGLMYYVFPLIFLCVCAIAKGRTCPGRPSGTSIMKHSWSRPGPNPQLGVVPGRAQPRSAKLQPAHKHVNEK